MLIFISAKFCLDVLQIQNNSLNGEKIVAESKMVSQEINCQTKSM